VVVISNSCSTLYVLTAIFYFDVRPSAAGPFQIERGIGAPRAANR
jgi:formamidase